MSSQYPSYVQNVPAQGICVSAPPVTTALQDVNMQATVAAERAIALLSRLVDIRNGLNGSIPPSSVGAVSSNKDEGAIGRLRGSVAGINDVLEACHNVLSELGALIP